MSRMGWSLGGIVAVLLMVVAPLTWLRSSEQTGRERVDELLSIGHLKSHLLAEALRLRTGMASNYDNISATIVELRSRTESVLLDSQESDFEPDRLLARDFERYARIFERLDNLVTRFATHNASVINAVASLPRAFADLEEVSEGAPWSLEDLRREYRAALQLQAVWSPEEADLALREYRARAAEQTAPEGSVTLEILRRQLEIAIADRLAADTLLGEIEEHSRDGDLLATISHYVEDSQRFDHQRDRQALLIQAISFFGVLAISWWVGFTAWMQSQRLRHEIENRKRADAEARALEVQLRSAQKLEAIGRLAAGIAHEINTPTQYVGDNTRFLEESFREIAPLLKKAEELANAIREGRDVDTLAEEFVAEVDVTEVAYLEQEIPLALEQALGGLSRVRQIVQSMKEFSHPGMKHKQAVDINHALQSTITVTANEWKYVADLKTDFAPELPTVPCFPSEMNQVFLNLIVNAAQAIGERFGTKGENRGTIHVGTRTVGDWIEIWVEDNGAGIPVTAQDRIFDPFFTTKEVGRGTGQGLAIAHSVVVQKHKGTIDFESEPGKGTRFVVRLPLERANVLTA